MFRFEKLETKRLLAGLEGDLNEDFALDDKDIDLMFEQGLDTKQFIERILWTNYGDADVDGDVDNNDLNTVLYNFNIVEATWSQGNFNGDNLVNGLDLNQILFNWGKNNLFGGKVVFEISAEIADRSNWTIQHISPNSSIVHTPRQIWWWFSTLVSYGAANTCNITITHDNDMVSKVLGSHPSVIRKTDLAFESLLNDIKNHVKDHLDIDDFEGSEIFYKELRDYSIHLPEDDWLGFWLGQGTLHSPTISESNIAWFMQDGLTTIDVEWTQKYEWHDEIDANGIEDNPDLSETYNPLALAEVFASYLEKFRCNNYKILLKWEVTKVAHLVEELL